MYKEKNVQVSETHRFFFPETFLYFGIFKELIFRNKFCKEKNLLFFRYKIISKFVKKSIIKNSQSSRFKQDSKFFSLQNLFRKISSF
jgi:hypothetical protein